MNSPAILFDIGDVLAGISPKKLFRQMGASQAECTYLEEMVFDGTWRKEHDRGRSFVEGITILLRQHPEKYHGFIQAYKTSWVEMVLPVPETIRIVEELHSAGYTLYGASNWAHETFPLLRQAIPALELFRDVLISGQIGITKPDPRFFEAALEKFRIIPENTIFIDDSAANVAAGASCGFRTIRYENPDQLRHNLKAHGIECL